MVTSVISSRWLIYLLNGLVVEWQRQNGEEFIFVFIFVRNQPENYHDFVSFAFHLSIWDD
jgi:hypothetical protein